MSYDYLRPTVEQIRQAHAENRYHCGQDGLHAGHAIGILLGLLADSTTISVVAPTARVKANRVPFTAEEILEAAARGETTKDQTYDADENKRV